ncbi:NAD(P)H-dependent oxidoreductase [bacterium]|nr:NAD(P)H-dependent oxidoreductase [bacterium]
MTHTIAASHVIDALNWRYATKKFDPNRKVSESDFHLLLEAGRLAPTSYGLQPLKLIVVQNPELRAALQKASFNQTQITDASHMIVLTTLTQITESYIDEYIKRIATTRNQDIQSLDVYRGMMVGGLVNGPRSNEIKAWAQRQAYIVMGTILSAAAELAIDACPIEGMDPAEYDRILELESSAYKSAAVITVGYRHPDDHYQHAPKVRKPESDFIEFR